MAGPWEEYQRGGGGAPAAAEAPWQEYAGKPHFDEKAVRKYQGKPGYDVIYMSPAEYLKLAPGAEEDPEHADKSASIKSAVDKGESLDEIPRLDIRVDKSGAAKVVDQDGRHRALLAQEQGIDRIPVTVKRTAGGNTVPITTLQPLGAGEPIPYQFAPVEAPVTPATKYNPAETVPELDAISGEAFLKLPLAEQNRLRAKQVAATGENLRAGAGKAFADIGRGIGQRLGMVSPEAVEEARQRDAPLMDTGAGRTGNIAGNIAAAAPTALIPGANTVLGATAVGAGFGALQPTTRDESVLENAAEGALIGGGITAAARALPAIKRGIVDPFTAAGQDRIALGAINQFARNPNWQAVAEQAPKELVPGSSLSLAEITRDPGIAQLQRSSQAASPDIASAMAEARTARIGAKRNALESLAGQPGEYEALVKARDVQSKDLYKQAFAEGIDPKRATPQVNRLITGLTGRDAHGNANNEFFQQAMREGERRARAEGYDLAGDPSINFADDPKSLLIGLHHGKLALDGQIEKAAMQGDAQLKRILTKTKDQMDHVIRSLSPRYDAASNAYEAASKPINRLDIGRYLENKLVPALTKQGAEKLTPTQFAKALDEGDALARKATGSEAAKLNDILTPDDRGLLDNMVKELGGESWADTSAAVRGSPTAQYQTGRNLLQSILGPVGLPRSIASHTAADILGNRWVSMVAAPVESKVQARIGEILANPSSLRRAQPPRIPLSQIGQYGLPPLAGAGALQGTNGGQ